MKAEAHRQKAERIEEGLKRLQVNENPDSIIEFAWGAAMQWLAFGCETRYQRHQNKETHLGRFLRDLGEKTIADVWEALDHARQGGWFGDEVEPVHVQTALAHLEQIRIWATQ